ncbi:MAG: sialidase family protein [Chloroflexota bacterium]
MRVVAAGVIYDGHAGPPYGKSCARTTVALLGDGTLLVSFRLGTERESVDGHPVVFASTDGGASWVQRYSGYGQGTLHETPGQVMALAITETSSSVLMGTCLWVDHSDPALPFLNSQTQGLLPEKILHVKSHDGGHTWSPPRVMETTPHVATSPCTMPVLPLADGRLAQSYETWKTYHDTSALCPQAFLRFSVDGGETWPEWAEVTGHTENALYFWDQRLAIHPRTGEIVRMCWTHDPRAGIERDVHIAWGTRDGRKWTVPVGTGLPGQHCQPIAIDGDRLVAVYARRHDPAGIVASSSRDFGRTWDRADDLVVFNSKEGVEPGATGQRDTAEKWGDMVRYRFGHPRGVLLPSGEIFAVWYAGDDAAKRVQWGRIAL